MTAKINSTTATTTVNKDNSITLTIGNQKLNLNADQVTAVVTALLAGRKAAYAAVRDTKAAATAAAKAEREAKREERQKAAAERKAAQVAKLEAKLAELKQAA
jgi:beta-lactam-binding protein with PASTA domain